jgi:hypothetical protein
MIDNPGPLCLLSLLFDVPSKDTDLVIPCQYLCAYARHWSSPRNSRLSSTLILQINPFYLIITEFCGFDQDFNV